MVYAFQKNIQGSELPMPRELTSHVGARDMSIVQGQKKLVKPSFTEKSEMPPPPPKFKSVPPPPPPPKFNSTPNMDGDSNETHSSKSETASVPGNNSCFSGNHFNEHDYRLYSIYVRTKKLPVC